MRDYVLFAFIKFMVRVVFFFIGNGFLKKVWKEVCTPYNVESQNKKPKTTRTPK